MIVKIYLYGCAYISERNRTVSEPSGKINDILLSNNIRVDTVNELTKICEFRLQQIRKAK